MTGSQPKDSKGRRDGTFSSLLSAVRAQSGEGAGLRKSGPQNWQGKLQEPHVQGPQGTRSGSLHPRVYEGGHAFLGSKAVPEKLPDMDNEGRPFNLKLVVVNFNNVGTHFGKMFRKRDRWYAFDWEGVRRCVKELTKSKYKVIGVIYQNWEAWDGDEWCHGIPEDIRSLCESIQETPKIALNNQRSADDEMTIKCAYHRNCCILDNDNYKDWLHLLRKDEIREWYQFSRGRIHMKYFFDTEVGFFETLDGNAVRGASEEREERGEKRKSRNRSRARAVEEEARNQRYSEDAWGAPSGIDNTPPETAESAVLSDPAAMMVPTETGFRKHKGPTITMPTSMASSASAPNTVDLTVEPRRSPASKDINGITAGWTALCTAAQQSKVQSVGRLLEAKADPNAPNCMGAHPLFYALCNWSLRMFRLLEKHGAKPEKARSEKGESLKAYAERKVGQAAQMKRFGAAYFASASRQELLRAVGARKAARNALTAVAAAEAERVKRRRIADRADPGRVDDPSVRGRATQRTQVSKAAPTRPSLGIPALEDPYGGLNKSNSIDLTETDWDVDLEGLPAEVLDGHEEAADGTGDEVSEVPGDSGDVDDQELAALLGAALEDATQWAESKMLVSCGAEGSVAVWDADSGNLDCRLMGHIGTVTTVAVCPTNSELLATGGEDHTVRLWDLRDIEPSSQLARMSREKVMGINLAHFTLKGHEGGVSRVRFTGDGQLLASVSKDCSVRVWIPSLFNPLLLAKFIAHEAWIRDVSWSPDQKSLFTAGSDGMVFAWEVPSKYHAQVQKGRASGSRKYKA